MSANPVDCIDCAYSEIVYDGFKCHFQPILSKCMELEVFEVRLEETPTPCPAFLLKTAKIEGDKAP